MTDSHPELNGSAPQPTEAQQTGQAVANALAPLFMQILPQVLAQAVTQAQPRRWCAACLTGRLQWEGAHAADMDTALNLAAKAAGIGENDPRRGQIDVAPFLPERLRPGAVPEGMPPLMDAVTITGGNAVCPGHVPGAPGARGHSLVIPPPGMPVSMAAALAGRPG